MSLAYDLAFVGGGLAATSTIISLFEMFPEGAGRPRIAVIDAGGWFGGGITYSGPAAGVTLLQNPVRDMPACLGDWLVQTPMAELRDWAARSGRGPERWVQRDQAALERRDVAGLFVPRALYGHVQEERYRAAASAADAGIDHVTASVQGISRVPSGFALDLGAGQGALEARRVMLCPGLVPRAPVPGVLRYLDQRPEAFVAALSKAGEAGGNVALIGANAAAMDVIHILDLHDDLLPPDLQVTVLSRSGHLPPAMDLDAPVPDAPESTFLRAETRPGDADALIAMLKRDAQARLAAGVAPATLGAEGGVGVLMDCLDAFPGAERQRLLEAYGRELSLLARRAVPAYRAAADRLIASGRLDLRKATVQSVRAMGQGAEIVLDDGLPALRAPAVIDCRGAGTLFETGSDLMRLLASGAVGARANGAGSGLIVDDRLAAAEGVYVLGDLLTGYDGAHGAIWHLQSAPRIESYAKVLARSLLQSLGF